MTDRLVILCIFLPAHHIEGCQVGTPQLAGLLVNCLDEPFLQLLQHHWVDSIQTYTVVRVPVVKQVAKHFILDCKGFTLLCHIYEHRRYSVNLAIINCQIPINTTIKLSTCNQVLPLLSKDLQQDRIQQWCCVSHYYSPSVPVPCIILLCFSFSL